MGLRIGTNIQGLTALRALGLNQRRENSAFEKLSTGLRINRASDNPAGLVLLEQLRSQLTSIQQATENTHQGRDAPPGCRTERYRTRYGCQPASPLRGHPRCSSR